VGSTNEDGRHNRLLGALPEPIYHDCMDRVEPRQMLHSSDTRIVGLPVFPSEHSLPMDVLTQVPGRALRMDAATFREVLAGAGGSSSIVLQRYTQTIVMQLAQNVACRLHSVEQRAARWLLMAADRVQGPRFLLTQEFLAHMLGVRRASVNEVAGRLADDGTITAVLERMLGDTHAAADAAEEHSTTPAPR